MQSKVTQQKTSAMSGKIDGDTSNHFPQDMDVNTDDILCKEECTKQLADDSDNEDSDCLDVENDDSTAKISESKRLVYCVFHKFKQLYTL